MAGSTAAKAATDDETAMHSVAAAMRDAAATATEHAAQVKQTAGEIGSGALHSVSRMTYTGSYILAYGVVYAAVFITQSLPQENPIMHGFRDGGRAALDELGGG
jgi:hypothetical protein